MKPLAGRTIVVTRPRAQAGALAERLAKAGADVVCAPVIKIAPPASYAALDRALVSLCAYDHVVFTSQNAVESFFARAKKLKLDLGRPKAWCVGPKTAKALKKHGWRAPWAQESHGAALARELSVARGERVLLPRAKKANPELPAILRKRGARVSVVEAYRTVPDAESAPKLRKLADAGKIDAVTFTSASTAEHLARQLGRARLRRLFSRAAAASIGPVTTRALEALRLPTIVQAKGADDKALARALERHFAR